MGRRTAQTDQTRPQMSVCITVFLLSAALRIYLHFKHSVATLKISQGLQILVAVCTGNHCSSAFLSVASDFSRKCLRFESQLEAL